MSAFKEISTQSPHPEAPVSICYATRSGGTTLDRDSAGGNPFATALIELSSRIDVRIANFPTLLSELTTKLSHGHQSPEWVGAEPSVDWRLSQPTIGSKARRAALVLVVSDYSYSGSGSLAGAAWDELRVSAMLARNGFSVTQGVGSSRKEILCAIDAFSKVSRDSDMAIIYATGHGREAEGQVYLIPGDFFMGWRDPSTELTRGAVNVSKLADACSARTINLVFFAGCRTI
jgi:hypothetical protein